ncbi:FMN-binding glutamate synthase family protein [Pokkaliibacter sp. CJK22405]|uniref:FMN-binding glutamate synthase family protein n=1 Tax=Pokkaliibacter sp. CJK22405 TaxID=3384615 RepID=UPI003984C83D
MKSLLNHLSEFAIRAIVPLVAVLVLILASISLYPGPWFWIIAVVSVAVIIFGIYDFNQREFTLTRNYPVAARIRWLFYDLRPFLRQYIVEGDLEGTPYSFEARNLVHARARGKTDTQPFGTEQEVDREGYIWVSHSMAPANEPEKDPRVTIGNEQTSKPYDASVLNISAMSFGALSAKAIEALNKGAKIGNFYHDTGEGGLSKYHLKHGGDIVWELGTGYFGCRDDKGNFDPHLFADQAQQDVVKMTEIKLNQGAKPGHGGMLPGAKVTPEIAEARRIPVFQDCLSPHGHSAFSTPVEMLEFVAKMRELSGGKPVGLKFCVGLPHEVFALMKAMLKTGIYPDYIVVDGGEGGTGAAPQELSDWVGMPLTEGLVLVRNALVGTGLRQHVKLAASGKIYSGMGLAKNLALGADWCNAARAFMFSIGCIQAKRCHLGTCPTGITTQDAWRQRGLVVDVQAERAARFHEKTIEALMDIVSSAGHTHPKDLDAHHLTARIDATQSKPLIEIHPFLPRNILLDEPEETPYAAWWKAADADTFAPRTDLVDAFRKSKINQQKGYEL